MTLNEVLLRTGEHLAAAAAAKRPLAQASQSQRGVGVQGRYLGRHDRLTLPLMRLGVSRLAGGSGPTRLAGDVPGFLALTYRLNPVTGFVSRHLGPRLGRPGDFCRVARHVCPRLRSV